MGQLNNAAAALPFARHVSAGNKASRGAYRDAAIAHYRRAIEVAQRYNSVDFLITARMLLLDEYAQCGRLADMDDEIIVLLQDSRRAVLVTLFGNISSTETQSIRHDAMLLALSAHHEAGASSERIDELTDRLCVESPTAELRGEALTCTAEVLAGRGRSRAAAHSFAEAADEYAAAGDINKQARRLWSAALLYADTDALERVQFCAESAMRLFDSIDKRELAADCALLLGDVSAGSDNHETAYRLYSEAEKRFSATGNTRLQLTSEILRGYSSNPTRFLRRATRDD